MTDTKAISATDVTLGDLVHIINSLNGNNHVANRNNETVTAFEIGRPYLIRTVTMIDTGIIKSVSEHEIVLTDAAWIADTGRFSDAIAAATFNEVEPFPDGKVIVGRGSIIDAVPILAAPRKKQ